jgi:replicative DNA helicase
MNEYEEDDDRLEPEDNDQPDGSAVLNDAVKNFTDRLRGLGPKPISTGIKAIDRAILGFRPAKMYVVGARPGMGKTAMSTSWRRNVVDQGFVVVEFNLEMGLEEIGERELAFRSGVNLRKIMSGINCSPEEVERIQQAAATINPGLWWVYDNVFSLDAIVAKCRAAHKRAKKEGKKIGLVVIDYIGLIADVNENRQQSVSQCSRTFKMLSKELDCAFVVLTQLNRQCDYRPPGERKPVLADIRESGALEQDADVVAFIYREYIYDKSVPQEEALFVIGKQRAGPTGDVRVRFNPHSVHYDDWPLAPPAPEGGTVSPTPAGTAADGTPHDADGVIP